MTVPLSGVSNARVRITSLRSESGIGIELLDYETPTSGRPIPADAQINDIVCWQILMEATDTATTIGVFPNTHWIKLPSSNGSLREARWIKDPDGHVIELVKHGPTEEPIKQ